MVKNKEIKQIIDTLSKYLHGKERAITLSLITFFSKGHLLIEDLPGLGKTTLALGLAKTLGLSFSRIQFTSDLLPSDIIGVSIYKKEKEEFEFQKGPIFNNIVLVDEINRATPKTQSALLEAMGEKQISIEGKTYKLSQPFFVIATQNPVEQFGTFPLPESQLDRFMMRISIGYPSKQAEKEILKGGSKREDIYKIEPILTKDEVIKIQQEIQDNIYLSEKIIDYILDVVDITRKTKFLHVGLSIRGTLAIAKASKTNAFFKGRDYVIPEDIKELAPYLITHRVIFKEEYETSDKQELIKSLIEEIKVPV